MNIRRFDSRQELDAALAERLKRAFVEDGAVMLTGGRAPRPAYESLGAQSLSAAAGLHLLYSDDRHVPPSSDASNYRASLPLLSALALPEPQVLRVRTELSLDEAAADYEQRLREHVDFGTRFTLGLLGLGADGHVASLFSFADLGRAHGHLAIAVQRPDGMGAVSVTPHLLSQIEHVLMVVADAEKRQALKALLAKSPASIAWRALERCRSIEIWSSEHGL